MKRASSVFQIDRFLRVFVGREALLQSYLRRFEGAEPRSDEAFTIEAVVEHLKTDFATRSAVMAGLMQAADLTNESGHDLLVNLCERENYRPADLHALPHECLSLKILTERRGIFDHARDLQTLSTAERLALFRGAGVVEPSVSDEALDEFAELVRQHCRQKLGSEKVIVRHHVEDGVTAVVVYYEKRVKTEVVLAGSDHRPILSTTTFRPAEQDFLTFDPEHHQIAINSARGQHDEVLRKGFARTFLRNENYFESQRSMQLLNLGIIADDDFEMMTDEGAEARITELHYDCPNDVHEPQFVVKSDDVRDTLVRKNMIHTLRSSLIKKAVIRIPLPGARRPRTVELRVPTKLNYSKSTHAMDILRYLNSWGLLRG